MRNHKAQATKGQFAPVEFGIFNSGSQRWATIRSVPSRIEFGTKVNAKQFASVESAEDFLLEAGLAAVTAGPSAGISVKRV